MHHSKIIVACAGFSVPRAAWALSGDTGSHLERTARLFDGVEVNTCFYRPHRPETWKRWAETVPPHFRFAVKLTREATHVKRLTGVDAELDRCFSEVGALGDKLGPVLVQLPPSLAFSAATAARFFTALRARHRGAVVLEPRHSTWFSKEAVALTQGYGVAGVAADPAPVPAAAAPRGNDDVLYFRWHGSPEIYLSSYSDSTLAGLAAKAQAAAARGATVWCLFDNTMVGAATFDALRLKKQLTTAPYAMDDARSLPT